MLVAIASALGCATGRAASPPASAVPASGTATQSAPTARQDSTPPPPPGAGAVSAPNADPFPSTYRPVTARPVAIRNATILTAAGPSIQNGTIVLRDGKIAALGANVAVPPDAVVVDGGGKYVTPGVIDTHSHLGVYAAPGGDALSDGNEMTSPSTPQVWAEHSVWPQDPQFPRALSAGVTTIQILPGSANLFGGRSVVLKVVPSRTVQGMKFPGAKYGLKMACGENPKRVYGRDRKTAPVTRMGEVALLRQKLEDARAYKPEDGKPLDHGKVALRRVVAGEALIQNHCYRADEMLLRMDLFQEFGVKPRAFHHAVEAYKIRTQLAANDVAAVVWADWWGSKIEMLDAVQANAALLDAAGVRVALHSDSPYDIQRLNQQAARALAAGKRAGIEVDRERALRWITANPAWVLGIDAQVGTLEPGKDADVTIWSGDPFSIYTRADLVLIAGQRVYDRKDPARFPVSDFELGLGDSDVRPPARGARR